MSDNKNPKIITRLMLPNPEGLSVKQLQALFIDVSNKFITSLDNCKEIEELKDLQAYIRSITVEIEKKQDGKYIQNPPIIPGK
jgi:hypothetical protein